MIFGSILKLYYLKCFGSWIYFGMMLAVVTHCWRMFTSTCECSYLHMYW